MAKKQTKPVVVVQQTPWGNDVDPEGLQAGRDAFYVSGYSEKREAFDQATREGEAGIPLTHRFQYVSVQRASGAPTKEKEAFFRSRGYIPVTRENAASFGVDAEKSGFIFEADGTARVGSQLLMVCPANKVAGHARALAAQNRALSESAKGRMQEATDDFNRRHPSYTPTAFEFDERADDQPFAFEEKLFKGK